ncbi:hypothetical protein CSB70_3813 [Acinetobacter baumannii]|nr:hypothetical protein CSB70_3813 [Acinetobacter baumannii]
MSNPLGLRRKRVVIDNIMLFLNSAYKKNNFLGEINDRYVGKTSFKV